MRGIHRWPVNSPQKGQWRGALMFSLICAWINVWVNNREAGDLRRRRAHYEVIIMSFKWHVEFLKSGAFFASVKRQTLCFPVCLQCVINLKRFVGIRLWFHHFRGSRFGLHYNSKNILAWKWNTYIDYVVVPWDPLILILCVIIPSSLIFHTFSPDIKVNTEIVYPFL